MLRVKFLTATFCVFLNAATRGPIRQRRNKGHGPLVVVKGASSESLFVGLCRPSEWEIKFQTPLPAPAVHEPFTLPLSIDPLSDPLYAERATGIPKSNGCPGRWNEQVVSGPSRGRSGTPWPSPRPRSARLCPPASPCSPRPPA